MRPRHPAALAVMALVASGLTLPLAQARDAAPTSADQRWATMSGYLVATGDEDPVYAVVGDEGPPVPVTGELAGAAGDRVTVRVQVPSALDVLDGSWRSRENLDTWGRPLAAQVTHQAGVTAATTPVEHTVYVARSTKDGAVSSMGDDDVLRELGLVAEYWFDEADGRLAGFELPDEAGNSGQLKTYETTATVSDLCTFGGETSFFTMAEEAAVLFPGAQFTGPDATDLLVVVTPDGLTCPDGASSGRASLGTGFASGGVAMVRGGPSTLTGALGHELGHNFGFEHSNIGTVPYLNLYNVMGAGVADVHQLTALSTAYRVGAGIDEPGEISTVAIPDPTQSVTRTETIEPRTSEDGQRALAVTPPDTGETLYVEYRSGQDEDSLSVYALGMSFDGYQFRPGVVMEEVWRDVGHGVSLLADRDTPTRTATIDGQTWTSPSGTVTVSVIETDAAGAKVTVTYAPPPAFTGGAVSMSNLPAVGSSVTATLTGMTPTPTEVAWEWLLDGSPIPSAKAASYVPAGTDQGHELSVLATAFAPGRLPKQVVSARETVRVGAPITSGPPIPPAVQPIPAPAGVLTGPKPLIKGKAIVGKRLTAKTGGWPAGTWFTYRWLANGKVVRKATAATLTLKPVLEGERLSVRVTAAKPGFRSVTVTSARTKRVRG